MYKLKEASKGFDPVPENRYVLTVENVSVSDHIKDETKGHRFEVTFHIKDGKLAGRKVWDNLYLPWSNWKMFALLEAGGSDEANSNNATPESIAAALHGLEVSAFLKTTKSTTGKDRTEVSDYKSLTEVEGLATGEDSGLDFTSLEE